MTQEEYLIDVNILVSVLAESEEEALRKAKDYAVLDVVLNDPEAMSIEVSDVVEVYP